MKTKTHKTYLCPKCKKNTMRVNGYNVYKSGGSKKTRWVCRETTGARKYCYSTTDPTAPYRGPDMKAVKGKIKARKKFKRKIDLGRMMVFTAAQNSTPVHEGFFDTLKSFCGDKSAELCVIPIRYKNPTSIWSDSQRDAEHWLHDVAEKELAAQGITIENFTNHFPSGGWIQALDKQAAGYLYEQRRKLNSNLVVMGDVKIIPTTGDPLTGMDSMTHGESGIIGHTKLRLKCVATPQNKMPKVMTTTGAVTVPNYTDSKSGKKGEFHHVLGAVAVEIVNDKLFHLHQINARSDGAFIFKDTAYYPDGRIEPAGPVQALIFGDAHYRFADPDVVHATFKKGGLVDVLNPEVLIWHDLLDCYFGNPHHDKNPFIKKAKHKSDFHIAEDEVGETIAWMTRLSAGRKAYVIPSNHDDMLARWIIREDWKELPPENMAFYLETARVMVESAEMTDTGAEYLDPFAYWVTRLCDDPNIIALKQNEPLTIAEIYLSFHGDKGPRGARGTVKNLSQIGVKVISGHGHSMAIQDGHTRTGTMTRLTAEYVDGPNDWTNTHCSIDAFGKRHLHTYIDGNFFGN